MQSGFLGSGRRLSGRAGASEQASTVTLERVRLAMCGAMLACMAPAVHKEVDGLLEGGLGQAPHNAFAHEWQDEKITEEVDALRRQLQSARDLDTLWYLRPGLMNVIATRQGEAAARDCLVALTALFRTRDMKSSRAAKRM